MLPRLRPRPRPFLAPHARWVLRWLRKRTPGSERQTPESDDSGVSFLGGVPPPPVFAQNLTAEAYAAGIPFSLARPFCLRIGSGHPFSVFETEFVARGLRCDEVLCLCAEAFRRHLSFECEAVVRLADSDVLDVSREVSGVAGKILLNAELACRQMLL